MHRVSSATFEMAAAMGVLPRCGEVSEPLARLDESGWQSTDGRPQVRWLVGSNPDREGVRRCGVQAALAA